MMGSLGTTENTLEGNFCLFFQLYFWITRSESEPYKCGNKLIQLLQHPIVFKSFIENLISKDRQV